MADLNWAKNELRRLRRKSNVSYGIMVMAVAIAIVCGWGWWTSAIRLDNSMANESRLASQSTNLTIAVAYALNGRQYEANKAGQLQAELSEAYGRLGPLQRQLNDRIEDLERFKRSWSCQVEAQP